MDFKFQNLLGAPYKGGDIRITGDTLLSPVGNQVSQVGKYWNSVVASGLHDACL